MVRSLSSRDIGSLSECTKPVAPSQQLITICSADQLSIIWMTAKTVPLHQLDISDVTRWRIYAAMKEQQILRGQHYFAATIITNMPP